MSVRDHEATVIDTFNGLWDKGDDEAVPSDHFSACENLDSFGSAVGTRFGIDKHQNVVAPLGNVVRVYNYITQDKNTLLVLTYDGTDGKLYHVVDATTVFGPILSIAGMEDFAFVPIAGRAFISPFKTFTAGNIKFQKGMQNQFIYVYDGTGSAARKAAGTGIASAAIVIANGATGHTDDGFHLFGIVGETDTGYLSPIFGIAGFTTSPNNSVSFSNVSVITGSFWTKRHIVGTKVIQDYNGDTLGYTFYFIPNATIGNNVATTLANISFFDQDLLEDASHLNDNFSEIPAGAALTIYHNRLIIMATYNDISIALVSAEGEPEAISQLDGFLVVPLDGNPLTNGQELRDLLYLTKRNRTVAYVDNDDAPSNWPMSIVDQALGAPVHGIGTVIDSGGASTDYLIVATFLGICLFNGRYILPELSWKIDNFWQNQDRNNFNYIQLLNDPIKKRIYCCLPDRRLLVGDYQNGMDPKQIKWWPWRFEVQVNTIALVNINDLIIGAESRLIS